MPAPASTPPVAGVSAPFAAVPSASLPVIAAWVGTAASSLSWMTWAQACQKRVVRPFTVLARRRPRAS